MNTYDFIPLFYFPGTCVALDDDKDLLKALKYAVEEKYDHVKLFSNPNDVRAFFSDYQTQIKNKNFLQVTNDESSELNYSSSVELSLSSLLKISENPNRHHEVTTIILDYQMPNITGSQMARCLKKFEISK